MNYLTWAEVKSKSVSLRAPLIFTEDSESVRVFYIDGVEKHGVVLWKVSGPAGIPATNAADLADFEANHRNSLTINKPVTPRNTLGQVVQARSAYAYSDESGTFTGTNLITCPPNATTINDVAVTSEIYVSGGKVWVSTPKPGDWAYFAVVDKDDVLGLFTGLGMTVGVDVLEVRRYVRNSALPPFNSHFGIEMDTAANVVAGLYLRAVVYNLDLTNTFYMGIDYKVFMKG